MKVLVISSMYPTKTDPTFGNYVKDTVDNLKRNDIDSHVIASVTEKSGIVSTTAKYSDFFLRTIYETITRKKFDLIHAHYVFPSGFFALIPKYFLGKKLVVTAHGSDINMLPMKSKLIRNITGFILRRSDMIIVVSHPLKDKIVSEFNIDPNKIVVIPCGVDPELFRPIDKRLCREILNLPRDKHIIFHLSDLDPIKNVDLLIESYKLVLERDKNCILVIGGQGRQLPRLKKLVEHLNMSNNVIFTGIIDKQDVPLWLNASDVFALTSISEGTPLTVIEAMAVGINIVAPEIGGIPETVGEFGIIIKKPMPENVAEALMSTFTSDSKSRKQRIQKSSRYHWTNISHEIMSVYDTVL